MMTTLSQSSGTPAIEPTHPAPDIRRGAFFAFSAPVSGTKSSPRASERRKIRSARPSIRRRTGCVKDRRCPQFCRRLRCASLHSAANKIGTPIARCRPLRGPGPSPPAAGRDFIFRKMRRRNMSIEQQIEELRAELSGCDDDVERRQLEDALRALVTQLKMRKKERRQAETASSKQAGPP